MTLDHRAGSREIAQHYARLGGHSAGPWAHPPRANRPRWLSRAIMFIGGAFLTITLLSLLIAIAAAIATASPCGPC